MRFSFIFQKVENQNLRKVADDVANMKVQLAERKVIEAELKTSKNKVIDLEKRIELLEQQLEVRSVPCMKCTMHDALKVQRAKVHKNVEYFHSC